MSEQYNDAPNPALNIWNKKPKMFPVRKPRWGLLEVILAGLLVLCTQSALLLYLIIGEVANRIPQGGVDEDTIKIITADVAYELARNPVILAVTSVMMYGSWLLLMWYSTRFKGLKSFAKDFWVKFRWPRDIFVGFCAAIVMTAIVYAVSGALTAFGVDTEGSDNSVIFAEQEGFWKPLLLIGMVSIAGPIMEELFFRGFLMQALIRHFRRGNVHQPASPFGDNIQRLIAPVFNAYLAFRNWGYKHKYTLSVIISSVIFGFVHLQGLDKPGYWITVALTGTLGAVMAILTLKAGRLGPAIWMHMFFNGFSAVQILLAVS